MPNEVSIVVNTKSNVKKDMQTAEGEAKEGGKRINSALKVIGEVAAGEAVLEFGKSLFEAAEQAEKASKLTEQVIKTTGGAAHVTSEQVGELASSISKTAGVEDDVVRSGANLLLTFTNIKNGVGKGNDIFNQATKTTVDMTAALNNGQVSAEGLKSSSIQLGKALNDPIKGITALQRVGVSFTDQQKKAIAADVKRGDVMSAQKIILGELNREFGGAAAAQATPADKAKAAWADFEEELGTKMLPTVNKLLDALIKFLPTLMAIIDQIVNFAQHNKPLLEYLLAIVAAIKVWTVVQAILDSELLANPIGLVIVAAAALGAGIVYLATKTRFFQDVWSAVWGAIKTATRAVVNFILGYFQFIIDGAAKAFGWIPGIGPKLKSAAKGFDKFRDDVNRSLGGIKDKTVTVHLNPVTGFVPAGNGKPGGSSNLVPVTSKHASGGPVTDWTWINERGPEVVHLPNGSMVYPASGGGGGGGGAAEVLLSLEGTSDELLTALIKLLKVRIRNQSGGNVQRHLGHGVAT